MTAAGPTAFSTIRFRPRRFGQLIDLGVLHQRRARLAPDRERRGFTALIDRMRALLGEANPMSGRSGAPVATKLPSRTGDRVELVDVSDVTYFYAEDELTFAVTPTKHHALDLSLAELQARLPPERGSGSTERRC